MSRFLLGIDAGSSVTKAAVFDRYGNQLARGFQRTELKRPQPGWSEVDPGAAWEAAKVAVRMALTAGSLTGDDIAAVGISAAMVGAWLVDEHGNALRPGINWEDCRTQDMLDRRVSSDPTFYHRIFQSDGCVMQQGCTLPLIAWLREHEGGAVERAAHIFSYKDFLRMKLTGRAAADRTEAAVLGAAMDGNDQRQDYVRATLTEGGDGLPVATPFRRQDSSMLATLAKSDCLIIRPPHAPAATAGSPCRILRLP